MHTVSARRRSVNVNYPCSSDRFRSWVRETVTLALLTIYWTIALW